LYVSAIYLAPDVGKRAYELFVEDIEAITYNSGLRDVILILGDFNLLKDKWKVDEKSGSMIPLNLTSRHNRGGLGSKVLCDHPYKKFERPPKCLQKVPFFEILYGKL
jgi:hypothetical protein